MSGKALVGVIVAVGVVGTIYNFNQQENAKAKQAEAANAFRARVNAQLDDAEKKATTPAQLNKLIVDIALAGRTTDGDAEAIVNARYPDKSVRQRAIEQIQLGYQKTDPITPTAISRLAVSNCLDNASLLEQSKNNYNVLDVSNAWHLAEADLNFWLPYAENAAVVRNECLVPFKVMVNQLLKKEEQKSKQLTVKDVGSAVGKVTGTIGTLWDQTTKPISDKVDSVLEDFKTGYNEASK